MFYFMNFHTWRFLIFNFHNIIYTCMYYHINVFLIFLPDYQSWLQISHLFFSYFVCIIPQWSKFLNTFLWPDQRRSNKNGCAPVSCIHKYVHHIMAVSRFIFSVFFVSHHIITSRDLHIKMLSSYYVVCDYKGVNFVFCLLFLCFIFSTKKCKHSFIINKYTISYHNNKVTYISYWFNTGHLIELNFLSKKKQKSTVVWLD